MNKTPISILQEMMVKKCLVPNYELIHNGGGTHVNTFTYQVSCNGLSATGTGRCKKDAKHEAAKAMLETIAKVNGYPQLPASPAQSPVHTPLPSETPAPVKSTANTVFINAIGALQEICAENNLQEPRYESVSDVGPPHARVFTIHCIVSTFVEEGVATTKKQAKHDAAKRMFDRITNVVIGKTPEMALCIKEETVMHDLEKEEIAIARYPELTKLPIIKKPNLGVKISEYHSKIRDSLDENLRSEAIETLINLINDTELKSETEASYQTMHSKFGDMLTPLNICMEEICLSTFTGTGSIVGISLDTSPALIEMNYSEDKTKAKIGALIKIMNALHSMLI